MGSRKRKLIRTAQPLGWNAGSRRRNRCRSFRSNSIRPQIGNENRTGQSASYVYQRRSLSLTNRSIFQGGHIKIHLHSETPVQGK